MRSSPNQAAARVLSPAPGAYGRTRSAAPRPRSVENGPGSGRTPAFSPDIAFLTREGCSRRALELASRLAALRATLPRDELFAVGFDRERYWRLLADHFGLPFAADLDGAKLLPLAGFETTEAVRLATSALVEIDGAIVAVLAPGPNEIRLLAARLARSPSVAERVIIASPETIRGFLLRRRKAALSHYAVNRLSRLMPRLSAKDLGGGEAMRGKGTLLGALLGLALVAPAFALQAVLLLGTVFFFNCSFWKVAAALGRNRSERLAPLRTEVLPSYTVLVPLYREAAVVPDLVAHLALLDYPASRLQILFLVEADDADCVAAVERHASGPMFECLMVPPGGPRTKPKALTFALPFARGDLVVVFDAEDRPEPDQLRKAAAAFRDRPDLGCVQARLSPDNEGSWFARMFTLEYAANFEVLLPALAGWRVPMPLGGTSNHFPREILQKVGGWDPFNVTEDADLGVRLARFGYQSATLLSRTHEEAPVTFRQWLPQRRRWIKGWMQTSLVCISGRIPAGLRLPRRQMLAVHGIMTAGVLGLLLYPLSFLIVASTGLALARGEFPSTPVAGVLLGFNFINLAAILLAAAISALRGLRAAGALHLAWLIPSLPIYWALMSVAAWQALFQLFRAPSVWEKTMHGVARDRRTPASPRV